MVDGVKISQLPQLISADVDDTDELVIVDVSEGVSKKITRSKLLGSAFPTVDINGGTIDGTVIGGTTPAAVTGTTITAASFVSSGNMTFGDNDKAIFGAGSDLEIYHSGAQSVIKDVGSGNLYLAGDANVYITDSTLAENKAIFTTNGAASLYYDNAAKLATTSTGISVTGTATASGFTGDLTGDVTGNLTGNVTSTGSSTFSNLDVTTLSIGSTAITATAAELNYVDGVTSNIQTQLDTKLSNITGQSIKNLSDVYSLMAPSDGQILVWDSVNSRWQAEDNTGGGGGGAATLSGVLANGNTTGGYDINVNSGSYITFGDNNKAVFGAGSDLEIYSDGTTGQITGNVNVTGTLTSDGLTVDGVASLNADITQTSVSPSFYMMDSNTTDLNDRFVNAGGTIFLQTVNDAKSTFKSRFSVNNSTGDISFYEDTGTTPKFFWDASAESLGIGTSSIYSTAVNRSALSVNGVTDAIISLGNGTTENGFLYANASNTITGTRTATPYIFYTNNAERARIDSSGNLLVGKPSDAFGTAGAAYRANGSIAATASANEVLDLNRLSTDGNIMRFFKDGSTVGSIGTIAGRLLIENGDTGLYFVNDTDTIVASGNGAARDNAINLGDQFTRFKDLYLSGGVYLGGTGSANLLDDYEEGTWTPTIVGGSFTGTGTYSVQEGFYRKVGQLVFVSAYMVWTAHTGTGPFVFVLPFTPNVGGFKYSSMTIGYASNVNWGASNTFPNVHIAPNVAEAYLGYSTNNAAWVQSSLDTAGDIIISGCYSAA